MALGIGLLSLAISSANKKPRIHNRVYHLTKSQFLDYVLGVKEVFTFLYDNDQFIGPNASKRSLAISYDLGQVPKQLERWHENDIEALIQADDSERFDQYIGFPKPLVIKLSPDKKFDSVESMFHDVPDYGSMELKSVYRFISDVKSAMEYFHDAPKFLGPENIKTIEDVVDLLNPMNEHIQNWQNASHKLERIPFPREVNTSADYVKKAVFQ